MTHGVRTRCSRRGISLAAAALFAIAAPASRAQEGVTVEPPTSSRSTVDETPAQRDERMRWWREAKFGLFIHWGVYAVTEGSYGGKDNYGEWIMLQARIPRDEYRAYARRFNPVRYDPAAWARMAKRAGMRYVVITSKHHDGFALFPSAVTDWDMADATPHGGDLLAPLAEAVRAEGLKFGLYYSQAMDWMHPGGAIVNEPWDPTHEGNFEEYLKTIALPQVGELLDRYQPDVLWWDTPKKMTAELAAPFVERLRAQPGILMNDRLGGGYAGDMHTPEQFVPILPMGRDWETCMTMNWHWGYNRADQNWKSTETLIRTMAGICGKGGNFLLNVSPMPDGEWPAPAIERLEAIGRWMDVNGESIHGTTAGPFAYLSWGAATRKDNRLYLHVFHWPANGELRVPLLSRATSAHLLAAPDKALPLRAETNRVVIQVPKDAPDAANSVVVLDLAEPPHARPLLTLNKQPTTSSTRKDSDARRAVDGSPTTDWYSDASNTNEEAWLEIDLGAPTLLSAYGFGEPNVWPRLRQRYAVEVWADSAWTTVAQGDTDGHGKTGAFEPITAERARIRLSAGRGNPGLTEFHVFSPE